MKLFKIYIVCAIAITTILLSCKKDSTTTNTKQTTELSTAGQLTVTDDQVEDGINTALDAADGTEDGSADQRITACATITSDAVQKKITIDFGTGCTNANTGRTRSGKIIVGYTGDSYVQASARTIEFVGYKSVDTVTLNGTFTQSNIIRAAATVSYTLSTSNFIFTFSDGKTHTLSTFTRDYVISLGANLRDLSDNVTTITGNTSGINKEGETYTVSITSPVIIKGECTLQYIFYPASGTYEVKTGSKPKFTIVWGSGLCDKIVTVVYLGTSTDITLK